tara:strand:- start:460 stop:768 length:309 start_codon:yes stop_codon:yes gene_type:complete
MAKDNGNVKLAKIAVPVIVGVVLTTMLGLSKWTVTKTVELDKELCMVKEVNETKHLAFEKADEAMLREQRMTARKIDKLVESQTKTDRIIYQIAAKLDVDTP